MPTPSPRALSGAVFLSYAREDADAARRIADALEASGIEVWFDQSELRGGDAWDAKIRRQIRDCALFVPVLSGNTQARLEGYFRLEWKLAAQRTHTMAAAKPYLLPVVIDDIDEFDVHAPDEFRAVQWTRIPLHSIRGIQQTDAAMARFCQRTLGLLADVRTGDTRGLFLLRSDGDTAPPFSRVQRLKFPWAIVAAAAIVLLGVALVMSFTRGRRPAPAATAAAPMSESRQLTAKARALFEEADDLNRENYLLAEDILKRAVAADVTDGEAWATLAQLSVEFYRYGLDRTGGRIEAMRAQAERALRLAPGSVSAQLAIAEASDYLGMDQAATTAQLRALSDRLPNNWQVFHALGRKLGRAGKIDEAQTALARADELAGGNPSLWADAAAYFLAAGRYPEAEIATAKSLARRSNLRALVYQAILQLCWHADKSAAAAGVERWPSWALLEDRGCVIAGLVRLWCREPEKALAIYDRMPREYLTDQFFTGPRAALSAFAHAEAGHLEAARADWQLALHAAERQLGLVPGDPVALYWKAWSLSMLGDVAVAAGIYQQLEQRNWMPPSYFSPEAKLAGLTLALGRRDDALRCLERDVGGSAAYGSPVFRNAFVNFQLTRAVLELNPLFDPLRADPRFQQLLEHAAAPNGLASLAPSLDLNSIAVLAFRSLSVDKENEYFAEGTSEELINVLGRVPGLRVIGRTSSFAFKNQGATAQEIGAKLHVAYVLDGSVQRSGGRARINASLIRTQTGEQIWSEPSYFELRDVFGAQEEIAARIAKSLSLTLGTTRPAKTVNPDAHVRLLEGRHFFAGRSYPGFARAEEAFAAALKIDPLFAEAHAGLAMAWITRAGYSELDGVARPPDEADRGMAAARRAIELDARLPDGYVALGYALLWRGEFREAEEQLRRALSLNPNSPDTRHFMGLVMSCMGRLDAAIVEHEKAAALDPLGWMNLQNLARALCWGRRYSEALAINERAAALRGSDVFIPNRGEQARLALQLGRTEEAVNAARFLRQHLELSPRWQLDSVAIRVLWLAGRKAEANAYAEELFQKWPATHYQRGFVLSALDRFDEAIPYLERTPAQPSRYLYWDERWDRLREDPRFQQLLAKLDRTAEYALARETLARMVTDKTGGKTNEEADGSR